MQVVEGQQGRPLSWKRVLTASSPSWRSGCAASWLRGPRAAVDHAGVHEGGERVDLVADGDVAVVQAGEERKKGMQSCWFLRGVIGRDLRCRERPRGLLRQDRGQRGSPWSTCREALNSARSRV